MATDSGISIKVAIAYGKSIISSTSPSPSTSSPQDIISMFKAAVVFALVGMALASPPPSPYGPPSNDKPMPYQFNYGVQDQYAGTDFGQNEVSDGNVVKGSYTVQLPDGRKQTVNYVADWVNGYQAEVSYYGEAQYAKAGPAITFKPQAYGAPQPSYPPAPSYP